MALRAEHIEWISREKVTKVEAVTMHATEHGGQGKPKKERELPFR